MKLLLLNGIDIGKEFLIEEGSNLIGRWDPETKSFPEIDLESEDPEVKVSRKHALIEKNGECATICDLGSRNGTSINRAEPLEKKKFYELQDGDEINIGPLFLKFIP